MARPPFTVGGTYVATPTGSEPTHAQTTTQDISDEPTVTLPEAGGAQALASFAAAASIPEPEIPQPALDPDGALTTYLGQPSHAALAAAKARAAQERAKQDVTSIAASLAEVAALMHRQARVLEPYVEGQLSADLSDARTRLLVESCEVMQQADLRLARLEQALHRLDDTVQAARTATEDLRTERERLSLLYQIAQELNSSLDLDQLLGRVMTLLIEVVHAERGFLMLWDETTDRLQFAAARGADGQRLGEDDFCVSNNILQGVWESQQPLLTTDAQDDEQLRRHHSVVAYGIRSVMCAPLRVRGRGVGVVYVDSRTATRLFDTAHLDLLAAFCNQAAIAIDNARLFADLRRHVREISEMKTYMENIFASIASGVVTADIRGMITAFNRAAERIFGMAGDQIVGQPYQQVLASIGDESLGDILGSAIREHRETLGYEIARTLPQRGEVSLRLNVSPLRGADDAAETLGVAMVVDDLTELRRSQRQAEEIQRLFGRYVHPTVVRQLLADPSAVHLGGEQREISIVFADIRGYTKLAEDLAPDALVRVLNRYLEVLTAAIWQEEGTLTMFIGDALMAIFNAPLPQPDHAVRAVRAAWAMRQALEHTLSASRSQADVPAVHYGIGVHTGNAVVGNIGAHERMQNYTAIGDAVNVAQRLQSAAGANQILLSATTFQLVAHMATARPLDPLAVKGKAQPVRVFELDGVLS
jgi:adenylate cyclase